MRPPIDQAPRDVVQLMGYDYAGVLVYCETLERGDYWDGEHLWDSYAKIQAIRMIRLVGKLYDEN